MMYVSLRCPITRRLDDDSGLRGEIVGVELFALGAMALSQEETPDGSVVLVAGFENEADALRAMDSLETTHMSDLGEMTVEADDAAWTSAQRAGLRPTRIGPWSIRAPWDVPPADLDSSHDIVIDPGAAFGHGAHPSTVMAIELLLRAAPTPDRLIDVGTGTAVIAIIAARMGIRVEAIESDPAALDVARSNIERNATAPHNAVNTLITLGCRDAIEMTPPSPGALVVANVTLDVHRHIAPIFRSSTTLILSGLLCRQVAEAARLYPDHECRTIRTHGEWASLELVRPKRLLPSSTG